MSKKIIIPRVIEHFTLQKKVNLLESVQLMGICAEIIKVEYQNDLVDSKFKSLAARNHANQIVKSVAAIKAYLLSLATIKDTETFEDDFAAEISAVMKHFMHYPVEKLREFNDGISELEKIEKSKQSNNHI